jgi:hypothetical protein
MHLSNFLWIRPIFFFQALFIFGHYYFTVKIYVFNNNLLNIKNRLNTFACVFSKLFRQLTILYNRINFCSILNMILGWTKKPLSPSIINSFAQPISLLTTGFYIAIDSMVTIPNVSAKLGNTTVVLFYVFMHSW